MLGKTPNKVNDPFLKAGLGYKNLERLKKVIAAQPKMYNGDMLHSVNLKIDSPDSEETLEDAKESRLKMRNKMVQINYGKLNSLYETFVPQQEFSVEQTYFSIPSTYNNGSASKEVTSDLPIPKMPKESKLLKMFDTLGVEINGLRTRIDNTLLEDRQRRWMSDSQNSLREFYKTNVILMSASLSKNLKELKEELIEEVQEMLNIFESMEQTVNGKSSKENILQNEIDRLLENQDLLITISELKNKLQTVDTGKTVNTKKDVFLLFHEKCVARYALSKNSSVKTALFTTPAAAKSKNLGATSVVAKFRLSVAKTTIATNKVSSVLPLSSDSSQSRTLSLGHNLFLVGQFFYGDLEVAFRSNTCYVRNLEGDDLLIDSRDSNLYTIFIFEMAASSQVCLMSIVTSIKSWLWHRKLSHFNFGIFNQLTSKDLVDGLPKFKYNKDQLCSPCEQGKSKKASFPPKLVLSTKSKLELLHMDLCGLMRVAGINGKIYILVIFDDYSRYIWVYFLHTKHEAPDMIIDFINQVQRNLMAQILTIRTDSGTEFKNKKLQAFYAKLVEVVQTMLIFSKTLKFLWAEAITTACFTQNRSIVHTRKMKPKADIGIFIGYSESSRGFRIYNLQNKKIIETIHVMFDELTPMDFECNNSELRINCMNFQDSLEDSQSVPSKKDLDNLFGPLYKEYYATSSPKVLDNSSANTLDNENTSSSSSIIVEEDEAPQIVSSLAEQVATEPNSPVLNENADEFVQEDVADFDRNVFYNAPLTPMFEEDESSLTYQDPSNMH
ncbi:retrovirus-related pol polyprotein from transposon TNT 1-94 [Tanacetum coccineum]